MGGVVEREKPTALMRVVVGASVAVFATCTAGPIILILGALIALVLAIAAAVALEHVGALESPGVFGLAHWSAVGALGLFFAVAYAYRFAKREAKGALAVLSRWPVLIAFLGLSLLTLVALLVGWDTTSPIPVAGAIVIADVYFFSVAAVIAMTYVAGSMARSFYGWAAGGRYRAGFVTGSVVATLALIWAVGHRSGAAAAQAAVAPRDLAERFVPASAMGPTERERELLRAFDSALEQASAAAAPGESDERVAECMRELLAPQSGGRSQLDQVRARVQSRYGFSAGDAHDIVNDSLFNVCEAHASKPYSNLGAVLQTAGDRRAEKWRKRRLRSCPFDSELPSCTPSADESVRFASEDDLLNGAICKEDDVVQDIIYMRAIEAKSFKEIGAAVKRSEDEARSMFNNARARLRKRLRAVCGP